MSYIPFGLQRDQGNMTVLLHNDEPLPPLPYELQNVYSAEIWVSRIQTATQACRKWARPTLERIYFFSAFLIQFVLPSVISNLILFHAFKGQDDRIPRERFFAFRAAGFGIFIGIFFLFWAPLIAWKIIGKRAIRKLENEWLVLDKATLGNGFIPRWTITKPGIFSSRAAVRVTLPPAPAYLTAFHPNAPLPPYVNAAPMDGAQYGYTYPPDEKAARV
ncbi:SubName: Full=Uncharacterized protein {ECO:0000313/EMBL:CCA77732.1} [Serendipita indica DSM 11827]|uniref:Uncharacterized protein n=1 Tax=Serendipita indica (strain DSM 11827) TaxID=1109443 RepID=G4U2C3_SERID|nr:SubName: Full=Uncharacterized protein {ECO:0000313/EMBL:CCA77732.1} [Serendipita indica DSM 11827]CCA77732.1 hypothetical protein PIIN_02954 [Serendipita indica DSM 11827]